MVNLGIDLRRQMHPEIYKIRSHSAAKKRQDEMHKHQFGFESCLEDIEAVQNVSLAAESTLPIENVIAPIDLVGLSGPDIFCKQQHDQLNEI